MGISVGTIVWVGIDVGMWVGSVVDGNVVGEGVGGTCGLGVGASVSTTRAKSSMAISDQAVERAQFATVRICMFFGDSVFNSFSPHFRRVLGSHNS